MKTELLIDEDLMRRKALDAAKRQKTVWVELGQYIFTIYKDKLYRNWGFLSFEAY